MDSSTAASTATHISAFSDEDISRILGTVEGDMAFLHVPTSMDIQRQFEYESKRLLSLSLHLSTLGEYYKTSRIPRGMRIQPRDNAHMGNPEFRQRYEMIANRYSLDLILLNMEFLQRDVAVSKEKTKSAEITLKSLLIDNDFEKIQSKHVSYLQKVKSDLENVKKHKWFRDTADYANNKVYLWGMQTSTTRRSPRRSKDERVNIQNGQMNISQPSTVSSPLPHDFLGLHPHASDAPPDEEAGTTSGHIKTRQRAPKTFQNRVNPKKK
ncbi:uncharacterized protein LOC130360660 [Hyla sarda]|uniref:uncharacterized protein LOC130360660 n=1 Tax=Hyla sarda TaxID=327740 RepID=UPI0024C2D83A|nr:uncharacterized protein LOC130360660 [Hyla sarda]